MKRVTFLLIIVSALLVQSAFGGMDFKLASSLKLGRSGSSVLIDTFTGTGLLSAHAPDTGSSTVWVLAPSTWTLDGSGNVINTPVLGSEIAPASTCTSETGEVDATTGWTNTGMATFASDTKGDEPVGSHSLHFVANSDGDKVSFSATTVVGTHYVLTLKYVTVNGDADTALKINIGTVLSGVDILLGDGFYSVVWATKNFYFKANSTTTYFDIIESGAGNDVECYIDVVSLKPLTTAELSARTNLGASIAYIKATPPAIAAGAIFAVEGLWDAAGLNGVRASIDRTSGTGKLEYMVAGVWQSALINTAVTYSAGASVHLLFDGANINFWYNNLLVGTAQNISALSTIINNTYWGLFSTDSSTTISSVTMRKLEYGAELLTGGNMESGDPPTSWTARGATTVLSSVADERTGGSGTKSLNIARSGVANDQRAYQSITTVVGDIYYLSGWMKKGTSTVLVLRFMQAAEISWLDLSSVSTSWTFVSGYGVAKTTDAIVSPWITTDADTQYSRFDDISIRKVQ